MSSCRRPWNRPGRLVRPPGPAKWYSLVTATPEFRPPAWVARDALRHAGLADAKDVERWAAALARIDDRDEPTTVFVAIFAALGVTGVWLARRHATPQP